MHTVGFVIAVVSVLLIFPGCPILLVSQFTRWNRDTLAMHGARYYWMAFKPWIRWGPIHLDQDEKYPIIVMSVFCLAVAVGLALLIRFSPHH